MCLFAINEGNNKYLIFSSVGVRMKNVLAIVAKTSEKFLATFSLLVFILLVIQILVIIDGPIDTIASYQRKICS